MPGDLVQIHHAQYLEDIPFWRDLTEGKDPVMEIGCGHGRVSIPLLEAGRKVTGIDIDDQSLQYLVERLHQHPDGITGRAEIVQADIFSYQPENKFGSVIIPCNTFSTFNSSKRLDILRKIYSWLDPEGVFAVSMPNPVNLKLLHDQLAEDGDSDPDLETTLVHPDTGNPIQVSSRFRVLDHQLGWDWIYDHLLPDGKVERVVRSAVHDLAPLERYLEEIHQAGFELVNTKGDFQGAEHFPESPYLILIGRK